MNKFNVNRFGSVRTEIIRLIHQVNALQEDTRTPMNAKGGLHSTCVNLYGSLGALDRAIEDGDSAGRYKKGSKVA